MNHISTFDEYTSQLLAFIARTQESRAFDATVEFGRLAKDLFALQKELVPIYRDYCRRQNVSSVADWPQIPALPARAFKEYEVTSLSAPERPRVFHSSGTTQQRPGRHFHNDLSLAVYNASLRPWFRRHLLCPTIPGEKTAPLELLVLTPSPEAAPHSSLAHMFGAVQDEFEGAVFAGRVAGDGAWTLDLSTTVARLREIEAGASPVAVMGTAFSFVELVDHCRNERIQFRLPSGSRALETGGYKGRTRTLPKAELRRLITRYLGVPESYIVGEYGMSELSSQAYDRVAGAADGGIFHFPPWARAEIISPETGREVEEGETGLIRVFDLANVRSVMALQTEDLGIRRGSGFELAGRAAEAELRGCSLLQRDL